MKVNSNKLIRVIGSTLLFTLSACGSSSSEDSENQVPKPSPSIQVQAPAPAPMSSPASSKPPESPKKEEPGLTVEWILNESTGQSFKLTRNLTKKTFRSFILNGPLTLPVYSRDTIEVSITDLPITFRNPANKIKTAIQSNLVGGGPGSSNELGISPDFISYEKTDDGITGMHVTLSGVRRALRMSSDEEEKLNVTLTLGSEDDKLTIGFVLMSPPSKLIYNQKSISDFESSGGQVRDDWRYLGSPNSKLLLLQTVELQNLSDQPISIELPSKLPGKLWQKRNWTHPQYDLYAKAMCADLPTVIETTEVYSTAFTLLPLTSDLNSRWTEMVTQDVNALDLLPGERKLFGVYAKPEKSYERDFKTLLTDRNPKEFTKQNPPELMTIDIECNFECPSFNVADAFKTQCNRISQGDSYSRSTCERRVSKCQECFSGKSGTISKTFSCNQCYSDEYLEGLATIASYQGESACTNSWQRKSIKTKQAWKSTVLGSMTLEFQDSDTIADARYANLPKKEDPETRMIQIMQEVSIQN